MKGGHIGPLQKLSNNDTKVKDFNVKTRGEAKNQSFRQLNCELEWSAALRKKHGHKLPVSKKKYWIPSDMSA